MAGGSQSQGWRHVFQTRLQDRGRFVSLAEDRRADSAPAADSEREEVGRQQNVLHRDRAFDDLTPRSFAGPVTPAPIRGDGAIADPGTLRVQIPAPRRWPLQ